MQAMISGLGNGQLLGCKYLSCCASFERATLTRKCLHIRSAGIAIDVEGLNEFKVFD